MIRRLDLIRREELAASSTTDERCAEPSNVPEYLTRVPEINPIIPYKRTPVGLDSPVKENTEANLH